MNFYLKVNSFFIAFILFSSCIVHTQNKTEQEVRELEGINVEIVHNIDSLQNHINNQRIWANLKIDSLTKEIIRLQSFASKDSLIINGQLRHSVDSLENKVQSLNEINVRLKNQLSKIKKKYADIYNASGTEVAQVRTRQSVYDCYIINLKEAKISLFWQNDSRQPLRSFDALEAYLNSKGHQLIFAMNAGMYKPDNSPQGLYIQDGKELVSIDRKKEEYGNFYMQPNGVFMIDTSNAASLIITDHFDSTDLERAVYATQSGPMVLVNGKINDKFKMESTSKHIRNGVGIIDENKIVFAISNERVNLYDFASVFKEKFNCTNALYLDGAISRMYLPELRRLQKGGSFGPMVGIYKY